jgi:hypothetical protein
MQPAPDDDPQQCERNGCRAGADVTWSPVFPANPGGTPGAWLCRQCIWSATEKLLGPPLPRFTLTPTEETP